MTQRTPVQTWLVTARRPRNSPPMNGRPWLDSEQLRDRNRSRDNRTPFASTSWDRARGLHNRRREPEFFLPSVLFVRAEHRLPRHTIPSSAPANLYLRSPDRKPHARTSREIFVSEIRRNPGGRASPETRITRSSTIPWSNNRIGSGVRAFGISSAPSGNRPCPAASLATRDDCRATKRARLSRIWPRPR